MAGRRTGVDDLLRVFSVCKYMGWDWETYHRQPIPFLQTIVIYQKEEAEESEKRNKKL